ncbi:MAG: hypothetical protein LBV12_05630 [Puniceicoccales bacterium]|jgi:hypothetical protein|nr:hypothetical protein [Puniceicoccales bacterium]
MPSEPTWDTYRPIFRKLGIVTRNDKEKSSCVLQFGGNSLGAYLNKGHDFALSKRKYKTKKWSPYWRIAISRRRELRDYFKMMPITGKEKEAIQALIDHCRFLANTGF